MKKQDDETNKDQRGFTLIELLVVVFLIGMIFLFALPKVTSIFRLSLDSSSREMASVIRDAYNATMVTGRVHRVVWDIGERKYWVESGGTSLLLDTEESREKASQRLRRKIKKEGEEEEESLPPGHLPFSLNRLVTRAKISLPRGVEFEDILTQKSEDPITSGTAYTHFFPHGLVEQTLIHLKDDSKNQQTLLIWPVLGRTRVEKRYLTLQEAYAEE
jgi:general secretion pathway protein H